MAKIVAIANQKGGVGKTTTTVNLAASLAIAERKVLIIDFDPQGNASSALGINLDAEPDRENVYHALIGSVDLASTLRATEIEGLWVAPSDRDLAGAEIELVTAISRENKLKAALKPLREKFDYILIDCPPSLGLLTINALTAADSFMVPLQCEYFALEGLTKLMHTVSLIKDSINPALTCEGIVLTMYDGRNKLSGEVEKEVREHFKSDVFQTVIPRNVRLSECSSYGKPIALYDVDSKGCTAYLNLAREVLGRNQPKVTQAPLVRREIDRPLDEASI